MADVVLLYTRDCPNVCEARTNLLSAFSRAGVPAAWREVDLDADDTPEVWRDLGSPSVLIDGADVAAGAAGAGPACRLYEGLARAPSVDCIADALRASASTEVVPEQGARRAAPLSAAAVPGVVLALLPKGLCPACWPAYAAVLSSLGLGFLIEDRYLLPITIAALLLATLALAYRARARRGYGPALVGVAAGAALVLGKFALDLPDAFAYASVAVFAGAAIWNAWPIRRAASCPSCVSSSGSLPSADP